MARNNRAHCKYLGRKEIGLRSRPMTGWSWSLRVMPQADEASLRNRSVLSVSRAHAQCGKGRLAGWQWGIAIPWGVPREDLQGMVLPSPGQRFHCDLEMCL